MTLEQETKEKVLEKTSRIISKQGFRNLLPKLYSKQEYYIYQEVARKLKESLLKEIRKI